MKQWGVFTNFYNGITISNREVAVAFCDTEDAAIAEAIRDSWKCYNSIMKNLHMNMKWNFLQQIVM